MVNNKKPSEKIAGFEEEVGEKGEKEQGKIGRSEKAEEQGRGNREEGRGKREEGRGNAFNLLTL